MFGLGRCVFRHQCDGIPHDVVYGLLLPYPLINIYRPATTLCVGAEWDVRAVCLPSLFGLTKSGL